MTFPVEQSAANTTQTINATDWGSQNMPAGIVAGDTLLALVAIDGADHTVTFTGGWIKLLDGATGSEGTVTLAVAYKKAVGSDTLSLTIGLLDQGCCRVIRIDTAEDPDTQAPEIGAVTTGVAATPAVGPITPIGGAKDYKFYAVCAHDRDRTFTSAPTNHQANDATLVSGGTFGAQLSWGDHDVNAATDDPDNFTYTGSDGFATVVVVVHPKAGAAPPVVRRGGVRWLREPDPAIRQEKTKELTALLKPAMRPKPAATEPQEPQKSQVQLVATAAARLTTSQQIRAEHLLEETGISLEELLILLS